jgi:agmatine deiminase
MTRRELIVASTSALGLGVLPKSLLGVSNTGGKRIPEESEPHERTWMALAHSATIWEDLLPGVRADQIRLANTIGQFEPVVMLVRKQELMSLKKLVSSNVELMEAEYNDLWIRDYGPQFLFGARSKLEAVDLRFNGWGNKQTHTKDRRVAKFLAQELDIPIEESKVVMEGGAVEVDGKGQLIATKSCIANRNRNPNRSLAQIERHLKTQFGLSRIVWLDGIAGKDITDGHTDFYARFLPNGNILANLEEDPQSFDFAVTRAHHRVLKKAFPSKIIHAVAPPKTIPQGFDPEDFAAGYINYYVVNGAVIVPEFGDREADARAQSIIESNYPGRDVVPVKINSIAAGGGGIHCATLHEPKA